MASISGSGSGAQGRDRPGALSTSVGRHDRGPWLSRGAAAATCLAELHGHPCPADPSTAESACARCGIRWVGVCAALDDSALHDMESIMTHRRIDRGQSLLMEGDAAGFAYNVIGGGVKLYKSLPDGRTQITGFLLPGDFLGLPLRGAYAYSAEALDDSMLCQFPRAALQAVFEKHPRLQARLLETVHDDLAAAQEHMLLLGRKNAEERVCSFLLSLLKRAERVHGAVDPLPLPVRRRDIADYLGLTIETVSRTFTELRKDGLIEIGKSDEVSIRDRAALAALAAGG